MLQMPSFQEARQLILDAVSPAGRVSVPVSQCFGMVLGQDLKAAENVPPFDRSSYDGYAFRAEDTKGASADGPVTLRILEEIPAGGVSRFPVTGGTAVKILTGAKIPEGADAVCMYEKTKYTDREVSLFSPFYPGDNIVRAGEDVEKGALLAAEGTRIDSSLCGLIAAQNIAAPTVFKKPLAGLISTGSELLSVGEELRPGKIYDSNRYTVMAELERLGCETVFLGTAEDSVEKIAAKMAEGLEKCDLLVTTGGVSAGDYDLTDKAMEAIGAEILVKGVRIKPGMACAYGIKDGKLIAGLSGNPASSLVNLFTVLAPAVRKICGLAEAAWLPETFPVVLDGGFKKGSPYARFIRAKLDLHDGTARIRPSGRQGNVVLSTTVGTDVIAVIPEGSEPVAEGTVLEAFRL